MVVGGLQKTSLIDFPGQVACVVFLSGCNFACPYCHNPDLVSGGDSAATGDGIEPVLAHLRRRRALLDAVVISGGEPTLNAGLEKLCAAIKQLGYRVKIDTNGSRPKQIRRLLDRGLVDYIAMDIKTDPARYGPFVRDGTTEAVLMESVGLIMERSPAYEFRTTCAKPLVDETVIAAIARRIRGAQCYVLQPFQGGRILNPDFFNGIPAVCSQDELRRWQAAAAAWVVECRIRDGG
jgi:pyruvate formate lyase activating enzyme